MRPPWYQAQYRKYAGIGRFVGLFVYVSEKKSYNGFTYVVGRRPKFPLGCGVAYYYNLVGRVTRQSKLLVGG